MHLMRGHCNYTFSRLHLALVKSQASGSVTPVMPLESTSNDVTFFFFFLFQTE